MSVNVDFTCKEIYDECIDKSEINRQCYDITTETHIASNFNAAGKNKKRNKVVTTYLHDEIIFDIFKRLTADSLIRFFKYECRQWFNMISELGFMNEHYFKSSPGIIIVKHINNSSVFRFMEFDGLEFKIRDLAPYRSELHIICSCNGFVLVMGVRNMYIMNPITKQKTKPPFYFYKFLKLKLVFVPSTKEYKIVITIKRKDKFCYYIWTLFGGENSWRKVSGSEPKYDFSGLQVSINGVLYHHIFDGRIVAIDLSNENAEVLMLPETFCFQTMLEFRGCLSILNYYKSEHKVEIYRLMNGSIDAGEWVLELSFAPIVGFEFRECHNYLMCILGVINNEKLIIFKRIRKINGECEDFGLCVYDIENKEWRKMEYGEIGADGSVSIHCNSLVPF